MNLLIKLTDFPAPCGFVYIQFIKRDYPLFLGLPHKKL